uniref:Renin receptor N-terminal domain-containing protein n=2 Tax=Eptatretus burgeri TaxID=7764 RepID=A0A8C4QG04_EPTBU
MLFSSQVDWGMSEPLKSSLLSTFDSPLVISINPLAKEFESRNTGKEFWDLEQLERVVFDEISNQRSSLNASLQPDYLFLQEMEFLHLLREMLSTTNASASPALVSVSLTGLAAVERLHGDKAKPTFDARQLLVTRITEVAMVLDRMCKGKALAVVATTDSIPEVVPLVQRNLLAQVMVLLHLSSHFLPPCSFYPKPNIFLLFRCRGSEEFFYTLQTELFSSHFPSKLLSFLCSTLLANYQTII